jgi:hypothetical protein
MRIRRFQLAEALPEEAWKPLERLPCYEIATEPRAKAPRIKEAIVRFKGYLNKKLVGESVAEFNYQPNKCGRAYRLVVVRKNINSEGQCPMESADPSANEAEEKGYQI